MLGYAQQVRKTAPRPRAEIMANAEIPIMVVDDARFSSSIIARILGGAGFTNVRYTDSPFQALRSLERQPADILLANWHNPSMDALELTRRAKLLDAASSHRTHSPFIQIHSEVFTELSFPFEALS